MLGDAARVQVALMLCRVWSSGEGGQLQIPGALAHYASSMVVNCGLACSCWQWSVQTSSANALGSAQPRSVGKHLLTFHFFIVLTRFKNLQPTAVKTGWSEYKRPISSVWKGFGYRVVEISNAGGNDGNTVLGLRPAHVQEEWTIFLYILSPFHDNPFHFSGLGPALCSHSALSIIDVFHLAFYLLRLVMNSILTF